MEQESVIVEGCEIKRKEEPNEDEQCDILPQLRLTSISHSKILILERSNPACVAGDVMHIGSGLSQFLSNRPFPGWGEYRTPVKKLYMCGASTHPGPGVTGGSRAAVPVIMDDLGIDFKKVVAK